MAQIAQLPSAPHVAAPTVNGQRAISHWPSSGRRWCSPRADGCRIVDPLEIEKWKRFSGVKRGKIMGHEGFNGKTIGKPWENHGKTMGKPSVQFDYRRAMRCNETQWDCHGLLNELRGNSGRGATAILYVRRD